MKYNIKIYFVKCVYIGLNELYLLLGFAHVPANLVADFHSISQILSFFIIH